jgi:hypothetical protein
MYSQNQDFSKILQRAFEDALNKAAEEEFEEAKKRLDRRKDEIIASITLTMMKHVSMIEAADRLIIEVKTNNL